jgi:hypothetical protein
MGFKLKNQINLDYNFYLICPVKYKKNFIYNKFNKILFKYFSSKINLLLWLKNIIYIYMICNRKKLYLELKMLTRIKL